MRRRNGVAGSGATHSTRRPNQSTWWSWKSNASMFATISSSSARSASVISPGGSQGTTRVMCAGTPAAATGSCCWRHLPTTASACGTGISTALWVRPLLVPTLMGSLCPRAPAAREHHPRGAEHLGEQRRDRDVHLLIGATDRLSVRTPPPETGRVAEPPALQVLVGGLNDQVGAEQHEAQIFAGVPSAAQSAHGWSMGSR